MKDERCVFVIFPEVTSLQKDEEVINVLEQMNFIILKDKKVRLTKNVIKEVFHYKPAQYTNISEFHDYIESGVSIVCLVEHIEGETAEKLNNLVKTRSVLITDEEYFQSLEHFCDLSCKNTPFYYSRNEWFLYRDLHFLLEKFESKNLERSFIILKPDVIELNNLNEIIYDILNFDLLIVAIKRGVLSINKANVLYEDSCRKPYFTNLVNFMTSPKGIVCIVLEGCNCKKKTKILCGPSLSILPFHKIPENCLKKKYGTSKMRNAVHVASEAKMEKEIELFFDDDEFQYEHSVLVVKDEVLSLEFFFKLRELLVSYGFDIVEERGIKLDAEHSNYLFGLRKNRNGNGIGSGSGSENESENAAHVTGMKAFLLILGRINCITCLSYLMGPYDLKKARRLRPNSLRSVFCEKEDDMSFVEEPEKIKEFIIKYSSFAKYELELSFDNVANYIFCTSVSHTGHTEKDIKLQNVLIECLEQISTAAPEKNVVLLWLSQWFEQKNREIQEGLKKEKEKEKNRVEYRNMLLNEEKEQKEMKATKEKKDQKEQGVSKDNMDGTIQNKGVFKEFKKKKKIVLIPDELGEDANDDEKEYMEKSKTEVVKYFEKCNYINLCFSEFCKIEKKKSTLTGRKIELTEKKYKRLTKDLIKRILKQNFEKNKLFNNYLLTDYKGFIQTPDLFDDDVLTCCMCLLLCGKEKGKRETVSNKRIPRNRMGDKHTDGKPMDDKPLDDKPMNDTLINEKPINDKHIRFFFEFVRNYQDYISNFLKKGKILIYRRNQLNEFVRYFRKEILIFTGITKNELTNVVSFFVNIYNYYFIDLKKLYKEEQNKKRNVLDKNKKQEDFSSLLFSFFIEKFSSLINKNYTKFLLFNFPFSLEQYKVLKRRFNPIFRIFHFHYKTDEHVQEIEASENALSMLIRKKKWVGDIINYKKQCRFVEKINIEENKKNEQNERINGSKHKKRKEKSARTRARAREKEIKRSKKQIENNDIVYTFHIKNKNVEIYESVNYFFELQKMVKPKVLFLFTDTNKDLSFIGLYLQFRFPGFFFADLNSVEEERNEKRSERTEDDDKLEEFLNVFSSEIHESDSDDIYNDKYDCINNTGNEHVVRSLIKKMRNCCSKLNAEYFVFSGFPNDIGLEDLEKLHFFFDIKLCVLILKDTSWLDITHFSYLSQFPFAPIFVFFNWKGNLLILSEHQKSNTETTNNSSCKQDNVTGSNSCISQEPSNGLIQQKKGNGSTAEIETTNIEGDVETNKNNEFSEERKKEICREIEKRIKPKIICYYLSEDIDLKRMFKKIKKANYHNNIHRSTNALFHPFFFDHVIKNFLFLCQKQSKDYFAKLIDHIKANKGKVINKIYVTYVEYLERLSQKISKFTFSNIVLVDFPKWEFYEEAIFERLTDVLEFKKLVSVVCPKNEKKEKQKEETEKETETNGSNNDSNTDSNDGSSDGSSNDDKNLKNKSVDNKEEKNQREDEEDKKDEREDEAKKKNDNEKEGDLKKQTVEPLEQTQFNKIREHIKKTLLKKNTRVEESILYIHKNKSNCIIRNIYCPKIIILFIPQNRFLQMYVGALLCFCLNGTYVSINLANLIYEEMLKERMRTTLFVLNGARKKKRKKKEKENVRDSFRMNNIKSHSSVLTSVLQKINTADHNILLTGFPIMETCYDNSAYFYQFNLLKSYEIVGVISLYFKNDFLKAFPSQKNISEAKQNEIWSMILTEFGENKNVLLYSDTIYNTQNFLNALQNIKQKFLLHNNV